MAVRHFLIALLAILLAARLVGLAVRRIGQPAVIGEILAGLILGPSLLGRISPAAMRLLFPPHVFADLATFSQVGVLLYMFLVGVDLDAGILRKRGGSTFIIANASMATPLLAGFALALWLYRPFAGQGISFVAFALFLGVALSVTAFPVLARILAERNMRGTSLGSIALASAAVADLSAWCLLALAVSVATPAGRNPWITTGLSLAFAAFMLFAVRPLVAAVMRRWPPREELSTTALSVVCIGMLLSALATDFIGIHSIFGAFLFGVILPHESSFARGLQRRFEQFVVVVFLPAYFAYTGLRVEVGLVSTGREWLALAVVMIVACGAKIAGTALAARATGLSWRSSSALGVLLNTRGLMELVVLNIGLDLGVISRTLFAILVIMAVLTTVTTTPLLRVLSKGEERLPASLAGAAS